MKIFIALLAPLLSTSLAAQGHVWIVDTAGGPDVDFTSLLIAAFAVPTGDTLLVRSGNYSDVIINHGLTLQADTDAKVLVSTVHIGDVPLGQRVVARGIDARDFEIENNDGLVWLEDCTTSMESTVLDSASVTISRCALSGYQISPFDPSSCGFLGQDALDVVHSSVHLYGTTLMGGDGGEGCHDFQSGQAGRHGVRVEDALLVASGSGIHGGDGGDGNFLGLCGDGGDGGSGIALASPSAAAWSIDCALTGGAGGVGGSGGLGGTCLPGEAGELVDDSVGTYIPLPGDMLLLTASSPAREGTQVDLTVSGTEGALAFLGIGLAPDTLFVPALSGTVAVAPPYLVLSFGPIPPGGALALSLLLGDLPPAFETMSFFGQVATLTAQGAVILGQPSAVVLLDSSF